MYQAMFRRDLHKFPLDLRGSQLTRQHGNERTQAIDSVRAVKTSLCFLGHRGYTTLWLQGFMKSPMMGIPFWAKNYFMQCSNGFSCWLICKYERLDQSHSVEFPACQGCQKREDRYGLGLGCSQGRCLYRQSNMDIILNGTTFMC